jgi:hypothetical protein
MSEIQTLLSLAGRQNWQQIIAAEHLKPKKLILLHSLDPEESKQPASRLKKFFDRTNLVPKGGTQLVQIPHDDPEGIIAVLDKIRAENAQSNLVLNFTGGNKLMATVAARWAERSNVQNFYLERGNRELTWLEKDASDVRSESINLENLNQLDPVAVVRCHLQASEIEREGELITLNEKGASISDREFEASLTSPSSVMELLHVVGETLDAPSKGDSLEYATALVLLKLGISRIRRSLRLKPKSAQEVSTRNPHAEIDLIFIHAGRLWVVDCKDRQKQEYFAGQLGDEIRGSGCSLSDTGHNLLKRIKSILAIGDTKALKEDLLAATETGGLLGKVICVRKSKIDIEAKIWGDRNGINFIDKSELFQQLKRLLYPDSTASKQDLESLRNSF